MLRPTEIITPHPMDQPTNMWTKKDNSDHRLMEPQPLPESIFTSPECIASAGTAQDPLSSGKAKRAEKSPAKAKKYKKAPGAPRRFKSAFIFFSIDKHRTIRENMSVGGQKEKTTNVAKMVSEAWKSLTAEEREIWEEKARLDRARYEVEVATYKGPWKVPAKRAKKPQDAPKRPMSAFLSFSNKRRMGVMRDNPNLSQAEVSALLSKMWNEAAEDIRSEYIDTELEQRRNYKEKIAVWREKDKEKKDKQRDEREAEARLVAAKVSSAREQHRGDQPASFSSSIASSADNALGVRSLLDLSASAPSPNLHPQQPASLSNMEDVMQAAVGNRLARQQETLAQLQSIYSRQQETLQNLMLANLAANLGRPQAPAAAMNPLLQQSYGLNHQQQTSHGAEHLMQLLLQQQQQQQQAQQGGHAGDGDDDWVDFPLGE